MTWYVCRMTKNDGTSYRVYLTSRLTWSSDEMDAIPYHERDTAHECANRIAGAFVCGIPN